MSKKIYIVDDDRDIVESLTMILESEGYEVASQNDEDDVTDKISAFGPDAIILDVMFPENPTAGFDIARLVRGCAPIKEIPIIMLSAINEQATSASTFSNKDRDSAYLPVDEFVEKPVSPEALIAKIKALTE